MHPTTKPKNENNLSRNFVTKIISSCIWKIWVTSICHFLSNGLRQGGICAGVLRWQISESRTVLENQSIIIMNSYYFQSDGGIYNELGSYGVSTSGLLTSSWVFQWIDILSVHSQFFDFAMLYLEKKWR